MTNTALAGAIVQMADGTLLEYEPPPSPHPSSYSYSSSLYSSTSYSTTTTAERTATTTAGRVIPSDAEDMLEPCVSISALRRWRGLDDTPDSSSSSAAAVDYNHDDNHNDTEGDHNDIEGEGHGKIVVGLSRRSRIYLGERLLCDAASSYDLCPPPWILILRYPRVT